MHHRFFIILSTILAAGAFGCGTKCDELADHLEECDFEAPEGVEVDEASGDEGECTEDNEKMAECLLGKSCDSLKSGEAFYDCAGGQP
jgi:hypothetical protein